MNQPQQGFPADEETLRALRDAQACMLIAITQSMPATQREAVANNLAELAGLALKRGQSTLESALLDLHRAVRPPR